VVRGARWYERAPRFTAWVLIKLQKFNVGWDEERTRRWIRHLIGQMDSGLNYRWVVDASVWMYTLSLVPPL
jgi:hypothetical protein